MSVESKLEELAYHALTAADTLSNFVRATFVLYPSDSNAPKASISNQIIRDTDMLTKETAGIYRTIKQYIDEWGEIDYKTAVREGSSSDDARER